MSRCEQLLFLWLKLGQMPNESLITKYNVPGPRYTSYPTVPYWDDNGISIKNWTQTFKHSFDESNIDKGISLYIHLPFCESLCTFCACHKYITKRHAVEVSYLESVLKEWYLYLELLDDKPILRELHLGGGTPTFFSAENLDKLITSILNTVMLHDDYEFSFEGHPNNTTYNHLKKLNKLGFTRVSYGVQCYADKVQKAIHRIQSFEQVKKVTKWSRELGYTSVSHDLIFGLPLQTIDDITNTILKTIQLKPDRISFYSYANVPWIKGVGQRGFNDDDIPKGKNKRALYEIGKQLFLDLGYIETGMDHFALPTDSLCDAYKSNNLHRNFMGYTTNSTKLMIGLGMSAIGDSWYSFAQNEKTVKGYQDRIEKGELPIIKGHLLTTDDLIIREHILNLMCHFETSWKTDRLIFKALPEVLNRLEELEQDGLVQIHENGLTVPEDSKAFIRNVCMAFDLRLVASKPETKIFSMTI